MYKKGNVQQLTYFCHNSVIAMRYLLDTFLYTKAQYITKKKIEQTPNFNSNMTSFFRFVNKRAIYRLGIISLAHAQVHVNDIQVVNVHVDELLSARIWQHQLCATYSVSVNINNRLPIKIYYRICTLRNIRIEIIHGSQNVL